MQEIKNIKSIFEKFPNGSVKRYFSIAEVENEPSISDGIKEDFKKFLGKNVKGTHKVIIGLEDNEPYMDYYYIIADLDENKVTYELTNSDEFIKSIEL